MLNIYHFAQNIADWKVQRKLLAEIAGAITKGDFTGDYSALYLEMQKYSLKELKDRIKSMSKPLIEQIGKGTRKGALDIEIAVIENSLPNLSCIEDAKFNIKNANDELRNIDEQIKDIHDAVSPQLTKRNEELILLDSLGAELRTERNDFILNADNTKAKYNSEINNLRGEYTAKEIQYKIDSVSSEERDLINQIESIKSQNKRNEVANKEKQEDYRHLLDRIKSLERELQRNEQQINDLREQRESVKNRIFEVHNCSYCGQSLPDDKIEHLRESFIQTKEKNLKDIVDLGKSKASTIAALKDELSKLKERAINDYNDKLPIIDATELESKLRDIKLNNVSFKDTKIAKGIESQIDECNNKIANINYDYTTSPIIKELHNKIEELKSTLTPLPIIDTTELLDKQKEVNTYIAEQNKILGLQTEYDRISLIIEQKKDARRAVAQELAKWEQLDDLIKQYEREYADIVKNRVTALFSRVQIEMTKTNKNDEIVDDCEVFYKGVPSRVWNNAEKSLSGIDIALGFMQALQIKVPIIIDNAESINNDTFPNISHQIIKLIVSETDYKLRVN